MAQERPGWRMLEMKGYVLQEQEDEVEPTAECDCTWQAGKDT